ncbi:MAG: hypothetical protein ACRDYU_04860 [Actinomycetes bacterium]
MHPPESAPTPGRASRRSVAALTGWMLVVTCTGGVLGWQLSDDGVPADRAGASVTTLDSGASRGSDGRSGSAAGVSARGYLNGSAGPTEQWHLRAARTADRLAAAQDVVARRAQALRDRDRAAFLATVDAQDRRLRRSQAAQFDNLARVPVEDWQVEVSNEPEGMRLLPGGPADRFTLPVTVRHRLRGYDTGWAGRETVLTLVRRGPGWRVAAEGPAPTARSHRPASSRPVPRDLWQLGHVGVLRTSRTLVLATAPRSVMPRVARETDAAVRRVARRWGQDWGRRVVVLVPRTVRGMASLLGTRPRQVRRIAAVTTSQVPGGPDGSADRVVVNPQAFAKLSGVGRRVVFTHEVTHVATRVATTGRVPTWLAEGLADYVGYAGTGVPLDRAAAELLGDVRAGREPKRLPSRRDFDGTSRRLAQAYESAWMACLMVVKDAGERTLFAFYRAVGRIGLPAATGRVLHTSPSRFTAHWRRFVRENAGRA